MKRKITFAVRAALTVLLLGWLLQRTDLASIRRAMAGATPGWVLAALLLNVVGFAITAWRWRRLLRVQGAEVSNWFLVRSCLVGIFFNNFLPSTVGGDVIRARDTAPFIGSGTRSLTVVLVERFSGILALGFFALGSPVFGLMAFGTARPAVLWLAIGGFLAGAAAFGALLHPAALRGIRQGVERVSRAAAGRPDLLKRTLEKIERFLETLEIFAGNPAALRFTFLLALLLQVNVIVSYWCVARSLALPVPFPAYFLIVPVATVILLLPVSINGIGAREVVFAYLFGHYGVATPEAIAFSWIVYGIVLAQGVVGGIVYALRR